MLAACGEQGDRERADPFAAAKRRVLELQPSEPRWEEVARLGGRGERTQGLKISRSAIQWRVRSHCSSASITLSLSPPPQTGRAQARSSCAKLGKSTFSQTGATRLTIAARGRWRAAVEQQLDIPLREPPLAAMRSSGARTLARGGFHPVESPGDGTASLYRLPNGRLALRLEDLRTSAYPDLFVWVSEARDPKTSAQAAAAPHVELGRLKSTRGDHNYLLPKGVDRDALDSVVIWRQPNRVAYTAAALE